MEEHDHEYRTGIGTDIHCVDETCRLMLGGVYIPDADGLGGYSDGDVALHAVIDALLGASGMGDIGALFPDTDPKWEDADSKEFLFIVKGMLAEQRWLIVNVDLIIHAEEPYLGSVKPQIKRCIASLLGIDFNAVNVKAKTNEGFGDIGAGEAIAATAIALLKRKYKRIL
ncbi:MAG: 2-C-methyl-D-erythritol 2,4-cyclodiphosphate synthase [Planctomycetes bacterium]|nr:2-C-methyl-D-erythritol 2,4-cyclodiphosphate synthase [Planctomycetota bacterium]